LRLVSLPKKKLASTTAFLSKKAGDYLTQILEGVLSVSTHPEVKEFEQGPVWRQIPLSAHGVVS
jgi:hypothetical protein